MKVGSAVLSVMVAGLVAGVVPAHASVPPVPGATVEVPVTLALTESDDGAYYPTVEIGLGTGGQTFTVILDTGSTALVMWEPVTGATTLDATTSVTYSGFSAAGPLASADFSIGGQVAEDVNYLAGTYTGCEGGFGGVTVDGCSGSGRRCRRSTTTRSTSTTTSTARCDSSRMRR